MALKCCSCGTRRYKPPVHLVHVQRLEVWDHRKPEWERPPAGIFDRFREAFFGKQHLRVMPGASARIFVNSFLHKEGRLRVDEICERRFVADRGLASKKSVEQLHCGKIPVAKEIQMTSRTAKIAPTERNVVGAIK